MKYIIGKKVGMTQIFDEKGRMQSVTLIEASPARVTQVIEKEKNGYSAVQLGVGDKKLNKPERGHVKEFLKDDKNKGFAVLREFRIDDTENVKRGDEVKVDQFEVGDKVNVRGTAKAKGFQGVVKRHGFRGAASKTHGQKHTLRAPGSIGATKPSRVLKGKKMAGRMGGGKESVLNLKVLYVDPEQNVLGVKGAVPGNAGGYVEVRADSK